MLKPALTYAKYKYGKIFKNEVYFVYNVMLVSGISKKQYFNIFIDYTPFKVIITLAIITYLHTQNS